MKKQVTTKDALMNENTKKKPVKSSLKNKISKYDIDFYSILRNTADGFFIIDSKHHKFIECNETYSTIIGYKEPELLNMDFYSLIHKNELEEAKLQIEKSIKTGSSKFLVKQITKAGINLDFEVCTTFSDTNNVIYVILRNVSEYRRKLEIEEARSRLLLFSYNHTVDELLEEFVNEIEHITQSEIGFIHFVDENQESLSLQNWSIRTKKEFCKAEGKGMHYPISKAGVWVDCLHNKKPVIINDYESLSNKKGMPKDHAKVIRFLSVPIFRSNKIVAILGVGNKNTDYNDDDIVTVDRFTDFIWDIVQQKLTNDKLLKREEDYRSLFDNSSAVKLLIDPENGNIYDANYAAERFYGWKRDVLKTMNVRQINAASSNVNLTADLITAVTQPKYHFEVKHITVDGKLVDVDVFGNRIMLGGRTYLHSIIFDITERKRAEELLLKEYNYNKAILDASPIYFVVINMNGQVTMMNNSMLNALGYTKDEVIRSFYMDKFVLPEEYDLSISIFNKLAIEHKITYNESNILCKDGNKIVVAWYGTPIFKDSVFDYFIGVGIDITEKRSIEDKLHKNEKILSSIFENSQDAIGISKNGVNIWLNKTFLDLFGYKEEELIGKSILMQISPREHERIKVYAEKRSKGESVPVFYESIGLRKSGEEFPFEIKTGVYEIDNEIYTLAIIRDITARKYAEKQLRESEERLKRGELLAKFGHWEYNRSDNKFYSSDGTSAIYGTNKKIATLEEVRSFRLPEYNEAGDKAMGDLIKYNKPYSWEFKIKRENDGKIVDVLSITEYDPIANVVFGTIQDITERKHAELQYKSIIQTTIDGFWSVNADSKRITDVNDSYCKMSGFTKDELLKMKIHDIEAIETNTEVEKHALNIKNKGNDIFETKHKTKSGKIIDVEVSVTFSYIDNSIFYAFIRDISERKITERKLMQLSHAVEQSPATIVITDLEGNVQYANPMFTKTTGYSLDEAIGKNPRILKSGEKPQVEYKELWDTIKSGEQWHGEFQNKRKNGELYWESGSISPIKNETGEITNYIAIKTDVTDRKLAEVEKNKMLEDIVRRNKDLEQFSYIISHNLRAPLANILSISELLNFDDNTKEEEKFLLESITKAASKLDMVVQDINNVLYVKNQISEQKQLIKFSEVLNENIDSLHIQIKNENVNIISNFQDIDEFITIKSYIHSIFHNLISNSIKYRQKNIIPEIIITSKKDNNKIILIFKDNGIGIDVNKAGDKLFGLYKRFHSHVDGKGMGLYMVKSQVETIGGSISIKSEINKGTEFIIEFNI